ncbi:MAG TPA: RodZ domain-containing protein [Thermoanaerobaculia bacterium]|nr:RodZ domain-containing protein [Thermoanaerobaculia bacterium]
MPDQEPQPQGQGGASELASFGDELRREREIRGISLKEIADATKVSKRHLDALERNEHQLLPAPVFTRGFVRAYAHYVGLNAEEMVDRYNFAVASDDRVEKPPQIEKYPQTPIRDISPKPAPKRGIPPVYARIDRNIIAIVLIMAALGGVAYWAIQYRGRTEAEPVHAVPVTTATAKVAIPPAAAAAAANDDSRLRLAVEVLENAWVVLEADGKTVINAEMTKGERRTFEAADAFRFKTIGNAAGLRLTLNGATVPPLGEDGEVVKNRIFDRGVLQQIRTAPAAQTQP